MSHLKKVDHVAYAVAQGNIEKWAWFHIEVEGGTLIKRIDDARPDDPNSSMKIWCIDYGDFGIALIEGIDRAEKSQVTNFVEAHGDHSCQHVAYDCHNLDGFIKHMKAMGGHPRGGVLVQDDGFGILKQMFAKGYASVTPVRQPSPSIASARKPTAMRAMSKSRSRTPPAASFTSRCRTPSTRATRNRSSIFATCRKTGRYRPNNRRARPTVRRRFRRFKRLAYSGGGVVTPRRASSASIIAKVGLRSRSVVQYTEPVTSIA